MAIVKNSIKCNHCNDVIISTHVHHYISCKCGKVSADGGNEYLRRSYQTTQEADYVELSEYNN
jgi:phage FluMu protein Com